METVTINSFFPSINSTYDIDELVNIVIDEIKLHRPSYIHQNRIYYKVVDNILTETFGDWRRVESKIPFIRKDVRDIFQDMTDEDLLYDHNLIYFILDCNITLKYKNYDCCHTYTIRDFIKKRLVDIVFE